MKIFQHLSTKNNEKNFCQDLLTIDHFTVINALSDTKEIQDVTAWFHRIFFFSISKSLEANFKNVRNKRNLRTVESVPHLGHTKLTRAQGKPQRKGTQGNGNSCQMIPRFWTFPVLSFPTSYYFSLAQFRPAKMQKIILSRASNALRLRIMHATRLVVI